MTAPKRSNLLALAAAAALLSGLTVGSIGNFADAASLVRATPAGPPPKPPKTGVKTNRWGLTVDAEQGSRNRHHRNTAPARRAKPPRDNQSARNQLTTPTNAPKQ